MAQPQIPLAQSNVLADLDIEQLPENLKKEGSDWFAVFNPRARRVLDVDLIHNLPHQSVVCCVRFSMDGRFVATGCNRSAQIFDVETGHPMAHLQDSSLPEDGDLYIRSVCFSPDGRYLATGAEDKVIRVSRLIGLGIRDIANSSCRSGTSTRARSSISSPVTSRTSTR
jgi:glucose repression regulatory protein TUP1